MLDYKIKIMIKNDQMIKSEFFQFGNFEKNEKRKNYQITKICKII